jgi:hypothetical protein
MGAAHRSALLLLLVLAAWFGLRQPTATPPIEGDVTDGNVPLAGARVHVQGRPLPSTLTDHAGHFSLPRSTSNNARVTVWKDGYTIGAVAADQPAGRLTLHRLPAIDDDAYCWVDPAPDRGRPNQCGNCHGTIYQEWAASGHANAARNRRFRNLYDGTDCHGRPSDGWNLLAQHPLGAGVCATCHAPTFTDPMLAYDLRDIRGVAAQGVHCDYCHKVVDAPTDKLGTRFGRDGLTLLRPPNQQQLFFGPLDDAVRPGEAFGYSQLYRESRFCASCHEGVIFGVHVYGTYSEWLESPARRQGKQCQSCHMAPSGTLTNLAPGKGGIERDPRTLASHRFPGGQADLLRGCLKVSVVLTPESTGVRAKVEVLAHDVGHRVPTGFIDRNLLLVVEAFDALGQPSALLDGETLPATAGPRLAGLPGRLYAKQLRSADGLHPVPFWLAHDEPEDTRLYPGQADHREFRFAAATERVRVRLLYRRFWQEVADSKGWPDNEIVVVDRTVRQARK